VAKFGKDPIYRTKVIVRKPVWTPACPPYPITFFVFIDFEKAFNTLYRDALRYRLLLNNINGNIFNGIVNM
jgi:hypothetical protein